MSDERFDRLENQLTQLIQAVSAIQNRIGGIEGTLQNRIDSIEGNLLIAMRSGFDSL